MQDQKKLRPSLSLYFAVSVLLLAIWNLYVGIRGTKDGAPVHHNRLRDNISVSMQLRETTKPQTQKHNHDLSKMLLVPKPKTPTHKACEGYDGIYHIAMGDIGGAAGTIFFQFVVGQILYAKQHNLLPWVHLNSVSSVVYDPVVHGRGGVHVPGLMVGRNATYARPRPYGHMKDLVPGPPDSTAPVQGQDLYFPGTGVWEHYFEPISAYVPGDLSCQNKLYVTMDLYLITPGIHGFAVWAPKCWRYKYLPDYITHPHIPLGEWLEPQRQTAHEIVQEYIHFRPELVKEAARFNPNCSSPENACLGLHIRHSDKAAGRRVVVTQEFLPFAQAFVHSASLNGITPHIYLATDSHAVLEEIQTTWPQSVRGRIRTAHNILRSHNTTAVFDMASSQHHRTNQEVLVEILALSQCQFMIHGLSAVSESSIWINLDLHARSVNLEDPEQLSPAAFGALVQMHLQGQPSAALPRPLRTDSWWNIDLPESSKKPTHSACDGYDGVLLISSVAKQATTARALFVSIVNQLLYAKRYNLQPWIHLMGPSAEFIHDPKVHNSSNHKVSFEMLQGMAVTVVKDQNDPQSFHLGEPRQGATKLLPTNFSVEGNGIWVSYFEPVSDFVPGDLSCRHKPLVQIEPRLVNPGLDQYTDWAIRSWRYDRVPDRLWNPHEQSISEWLGPMRQKAHGIVNKYFRFKPYLIRKAKKVNPLTPHDPCLGVHIRSIDKKGKYRKKVDIEHFVAYMQAFLRAGGKTIYLATDSRSAMQHLYNSYPVLAERIRTQGKYVVRSSKGKRREWLAHYLADHHRVNSEVLVDTLALSKCHFLVHGFSTTSEAAIYLNPALHNNSINVEDAAMSPQEFEVSTRDYIDNVVAVNHHVGASKPNFPGQQNMSVVDRLDNATIVRQKSNRTCRSNAIVYLAQKQHSSYGRDSYSNLLKSLDLLRTNYLSISNHLDNLDLFIFHSGDLTENDLLELEQRLGLVGVIRLVDLSHSPYWSRPKHHAKDNPSDWYAWPLFSEGYRKMMHWFAIDIWKFFSRLGQQSGCQYKYLFRLDEDSYIHSPIPYDVFELMHSNQYVYGYRMCAYEMKVAQRMWTWWSRRKPEFEPRRNLDLDMCGFYNNFFIADADFFTSPQVGEFLRFIDRQGHIYRRRLGDLMIHSMAVYAFAPTESIHRFLDFTYEHSTINQTDGCLVWGGIQAGYNDANASATLQDFYEHQALQLGCPLNSWFFGPENLSPTYAHNYQKEKTQALLHTITAGAVELPGKGLLSG